MPEHISNHPALNPKLGTGIVSVHCKPDEMTEKVKKQINSPTCFLFLFWGSFLTYFLPLPMDWTWRLAIQSILIVSGFLIESWRSTAVVILLLMLTQIPSYFPGSPSSDTCYNTIRSIEGSVRQPFQKSIHSLEFSDVTVYCGSNSFKIPTATIQFQNKIQPYFFYSGDRLNVSNVTIQSSGPLLLNLQGQAKTKVFNESAKDRKLRKSALYYYIQNKALYYLDDFPAGVYLGLTTADKYFISKTDKKNMHRLGISHLFAISGLHIGILYFWLSFIIRKIISFPIPFIQKGTGLIVVDAICLITIFCYIDLIGSPVSARRAFYMLFWWICLRYILPWQSFWYIFSGVGTSILIFHPQAIGQISYQLSFLSVGGILFLQPLLVLWKTEQQAFKKIVKSIVLCFGISFFLSGLTFPIVNSFTPDFSPLSAFNNVFHIAFLSWIFLPVCMLVFTLTIFGYSFWGVYGEIIPYYLVNILGEFWNHSLQWTITLNSPFLQSIDLEWGVAYYIIYWGIFGTIAYPLRKLILAKHSYTNY